MSVAGAAPSTAFHRIAPLDASRATSLALPPPATSLPPPPTYSTLDGRLSPWIVTVATEAVLTTPIDPPQTAWDGVVLPSGVLQRMAPEARVTRLPPVVLTHELAQSAYSAPSHEPEYTTPLTTTGCVEMSVAPRLTGQPLRAARVAALAALMVLSVVYPLRNGA